MSGGLPASFGLRNEVGKVDKLCPLKCAIFQGKCGNFQEHFKSGILSISAVDGVWSCLRGLKVEQEQ